MVKVERKRIEEKIVNEKTKKTVLSLSPLPPNCH